jgi:type III restriction enzyme
LREYDGVASDEKSSPVQSSWFTAFLFEIIETKGREDPDVPHKDRAAKLWCEYVTTLTGEQWKYLKIPQKEFIKLEPSDFSDLTVLSYDQRSLP